MRRKSSHQMRAYAALIAGPLIILWTNRKPTKQTYLTLQSYFLGWVSDEELEERLSGLKES